MLFPCEPDSVAGHAGNLPLLPLPSEVPLCYVISRPSDFLSQQASKHSVLQTFFFTCWLLLFQKENEKTSCAYWNKARRAWSHMERGIFLPEAIHLVKQAFVLGHATAVISYGC